ncbi:Oidioi.mRNA.OKI2018_I69.chr2.g6206.t1.cds [Oikopleura dioica]|uniref:Oidioi.mRNA.OKI2018_I69.chr2.g6206.t1.cds n=1 Tax=Oikopleura dioica TaxID=34765 RepID=A0ABN7T289_OIKDI|nr:Oidioi.mRNA.OKI2018_I69.chr2.g6206.t1.cds [Oikopleura dioica]
MTSQEYYNAKSINIKSLVIEIPKSRDKSVINKKLIWTPIDEFFGKLTTENGEVVHNDIGKITTNPKFENRDVFAITKRGDSFGIISVGDNEEDLRFMTNHCGLVHFQSFEDANPQKQDFKLKFQ